MKQICDIMSSPALGVDSRSTAQEAGLYMFKCSVGSLLIKDNGEYVGIVTETDFAQKLAGKGRNPEATLITEIMTSPILTLNGELDVSEANTFMAHHKIRHLVVTLDEKIVGIVSLKNLLNYYAKSFMSEK